MKGMSGIEYPYWKTIIPVDNPRRPLLFVAPCFYLCVWIAFHKPSKAQIHGILPGYSIPDNVALLSQECNSRSIGTGSRAQQ